MNTEAFLPFMIRVILGLLFFFRAYEILFRIGMRSTCETVYEGSREKHIPDWFAQLSVFLSTYIELIGGAFLVLGLFKPIILVVLGINLIMVTLGFSFLKGIWDLKHVFPRLALLIALFLIPFEWDVWTLDHLLSIKF